MIINIGKRPLKPMNIKLFDWLLIIGLALAPMTGLRIWKIGPGEILCLIWGIRHLFKRHIERSDIFYFFLFFIIALCAGSIIGSMVAPRELSKADLFTWIYLGVIAVSLYEGLKTNQLEYNESLFYWFSVTSIIWYLFLFIYSKIISGYFFGAPIWYASSRFSGGGTNPHQIAVLLCGLAFVFVRKIYSKSHVVLNYLFLIICIFLLFETKSTTGLMAVSVGLIIMFFHWYAKVTSGHRIAAFSVLFFVIIGIMLINITFIYNFFYNWISSDANGIGRLVIFSSFPKAFLKSPVFGLGPGTHGMNGKIEFHNAYLEVLAATGLFGGSIFFYYSARMFKNLFKADWTLSLIAISIYTYCLAGFAMRRLVFWGMIIYISIISEQKLKRLPDIKGE